MERILVTDGEHRASLAVVRSLGAAGYPTFVGSPVRRSVAGASRYSMAESWLADPLAQPRRYARDVADAVRRWKIDVVLPIAEASLLALLGAREDFFPNVCVPFPPLETFGAVSDKGRLLEDAAEVGIAVPCQQVLRSAADAESVESLALEYPLVIKPSRSVAESWGGRVKAGVQHAADEQELRRHLQRYPSAAYPLLLQQRVVGPGIGVFLLMWEGEVRAVFSHRRLREKPPSGGVSVYCESIPADPALVEGSRALLERFDWQGVAMVEYKVDAGSGTPYLMEVNGRFWGSLQLAIDAGVDFPRLLVEHALGHRPPPVVEYRAGVRSRWWWGDVDHLLARMRHGSGALALPPGAPGRGRVLLDFLRLWRRGDRSDVLRLDDPAPFARETAAWLRQLVPGRRRTTR